MKHQPLHGASRIISISVAMLLLCCGRGSGKDIRATAFPTAVFSADGTAIYYVQFDLHANVRKGPFNFPYARSIKLRFIDEVVAIHKFDLAAGKNEVVATLPRPPWVGTGQWVPTINWFSNREAKMWRSPEGQIQYEVHGPLIVTVNEKNVRDVKQAIFVSSGADWTDLPYESPRPQVRTELKYVVAGSMEVITSFYDGDESSYYLVVLDHDRRTARLLATGSAEDRRQPANFYTYDSMLSKSRLKGTLKGETQRGNPRDCSPHVSGFSIEP